MALPTQGVMLSERPSASLGMSVATRGGGAPLAGAGSIGNYKGVMLCNRPFAGVAAAAKGGEVAVAAGKHAFLTGKVKTEIGFAGKSLNAETLLRKRVKRETALTRHRRWLADLQLTKETLEEQYMEDLRRKEKNKRRFAERESRMRQMTRGLALEEGKSSVQGSEEQGGKAWSIGLDDDENHSIGKSTTGHLHPAHGGGGGEEQLDREGKEEEEEGGGGGSEDGGSRVDPAELRAVEKRRKRDGKPCRPKWAMTEAKAEADDKLKHEEELEELLEFTQGLDFGRYIRDAEVQSMIDQVKKRIAEIERQPEVDERAVADDGEDDGGSSEDAMDDADNRLEAKIMKLTDKNLRDAATLDGSGDPAAGESGNQQEDDNISVARTALSEGGRSVRSIHSTRSLAALAEKARVGITTARASGGGTAPGRLEEGAMSGLAALDEETAVNDIVVVTHQDDGGLRLGGKNTVSNLPYIRRNPAL